MASAAFDGTNYLVVWIDERKEDYDIYASRVSKDGIVLDPAGIFISSGLDYYSPSVAFDGTNYLVVWEDETDDDIANISGVRVSQDGFVLDSEPIIITSNDWGDFKPSLAFDGVNYFVVWLEMDSHIYGARVSQDGIIIDPAGIQLSTQARYQDSPAVAFDGNNYLVVWSNDLDDIYGIRVSPAGIVIDSNEIAISTAVDMQIFPSIAFDGDNYLIVWEDYRHSHSGYSEIYGTRVSPDGVVLDTGGIAIATLNSDITPSIVFNGTNYLVIWFRGSDFYQVYGARVSKMGTVLDQHGFDIIFLAEDYYDEEIPPAIASDGTNYLVACEHDGGYDIDIYGARVSSSGVVLDQNGFVISTTGNEHSNSCIGFDGTNYLVVWQDERIIYNQEAYKVRVNQYGMVLDQVSKIVGSTQKYPSLVFDGNKYLVVWGTSQIYGTRLSKNGLALDTACFCITDKGGYSAVAFDGKNYLVVGRAHYSGTHFDIIGKRVNQEGVMIDSSNIIISDGDDDQERPKVAFDGVNYLVVWEDDRNEESDPDIYGARINQKGVVLDPEGILISRLDNKQYRPCVAFDGNNYFVVWREERYICGTRVSKTGDILDQDYIIISNQNYWASYPNLTFDGENYFVVWPDGRSGDGYVIYGAKIDTSGTVIDTFRVSENLSNSSAPAIACGLDNQVLITWSGWTEKINNRPVNAYRIWAKIYPPSADITEIRPQVLTNSPNPFYDITKINYLVYQTGSISIKIYDIKGKKVKDLYIGDCNRGSYTVSWDGTDNSKTKLPQGIYVCQVKTSNGKTGSRKFIYLR